MNTTVGDAPIGGTMEDLRPLSWSRTVAREMVHRDSVAEVLLTDVRRSAWSADGAGFEAAASWSRSHPTFPRDGADLHSPLMIVETLRQLGIYIPLRYFDVAPTAHLLITDLFFEIDPSAEPRALFGATAVICAVRASDVRRAAEDGSITGLRLDVSFSAHGTVFAQAGGGARVLDGARYEAVRTGRTHSAAPESVIGRLRPDIRRLGVTGAHDVVLGLDGGTLLVEPADPRHPFFFDHATDHVPGIILLEAARQAAAVESRGALLRPTGGRLEAARFVEYSPPARIMCVPYHDICVFRFLQDGEQKAFGVLRYR
ncbi:ScbA/BarX family gamma-butyrolactone biosynthesis protein [Streptomyces sp. NPDC059743]|uniref:ScbA/BarX family gamma-butyrolactone biosynthesis protein n=1 Tax=Streptomyces sp. NPDC059743 TaxID=3346928 RepID=UPI00365D5029